MCNSRYDPKRCNSTNKLRPLKQMIGTWEIDVDAVVDESGVCYSVPCCNPKKETKVVAKVVATRCRKPFLYVANMVATITKNCDQHL